jgi:hypothetical protein
MYAIRMKMELFLIRMVSLKVDLVGVHFTGLITPGEVCHSQGLFFAQFEAFLICQIWLQLLEKWCGWV